MLHGSKTHTGFHYNLRFPGQYSDAETRLTYNGARYYDQQLGRRIQTRGTTTNIDEAVDKFRLASRELF